jgi:putative membrane protein insertion efficiency factor
LAVLVGWLVGTHPSIPGATEDGRAEQDARRGYVSFEPTRRGFPGKACSLEKWRRVARRPPVKSTNPIRLSAHGWIRIFQRFISPVDGESCSYHPSCSTYGLQAIEEHGLLLGIPLAAERIMRNHHPENPARYPLYEKEGTFYYWDPVKHKDKGQRQKRARGSEWGVRDQGPRVRPCRPDPNRLSFPRRQAVQIAGFDAICGVGQGTCLIESQGSFVSGGSLRE